MLAAQLANALLSRIGLRLVHVKSAGTSMHDALSRVEPYIRSVKTVIDVGAASGTWTITASKILKQRKFLAIEPLQEREADLQRLRKRIPGFEYELCVAGESHNTTASLSVADDLDSSIVNDSGGRIVPCKTLDGIVKERGAKGPFMLKFDTHGFEIPILKGATKTLEQTEAIVMEVYNFKISETALRFAEMCNFLEDAGFRVFGLADPMVRPKDKALWQFDLVFLRKNSSAYFSNQFIHYSSTSRENSSIE
jgi:FkbM family methyltransferase